jgi:Rod binding domain-containing protein
MKIDAAALLTPTTTSPKSKKVTETAEDFEALMIGQMLKSARADSQGWFGTGEDSTSSSLIEMAEEQLAKVLANNGGLGLSKMITNTLAGQEKNQPPAPASPDQSGSSTVQMSGKLR